MSKTYRIENPDSGTVLGTYTADSPEGALNELARDAGYESHDAACAVLGSTDLMVIEIAEATYGTHECGPLNSWQ